jgi:eukaryotic-like serine/threonine-protein kinase
VPPERAVSICLGVLDALDFMHSKGVIHRDIKPGNIMFTERGDVKVTDFGIAKMMGEKGQTKTGMRVGTLWYMSPEQIRGGDASVASDIYALGGTLYQMVAGRVPFGGDSEYAVMKGHLEERPVPPWEINSNVPRDLGKIILKALQKDLANRYATAGEFADDLRGLDFRPREESGVRGPSKWGLPLRIPPVDIRVGKPWTQISAMISSLPFAKTGNRAVIWIIVAAAVVVALILAAVFVGKTEKPSFPLAGGNALTAGAPQHTQPPDEKKAPGAVAAPPPVEAARAPETPPEAATRTKPKARTGKLVASKKGEGEKAGTGARAPAPRDAETQPEEKGQWKIRR